MNVAKSIGNVFPIGQLINFEWKIYWKIPCFIRSSNLDKPLELWILKLNINKEAAKSTDPTMASRLASGRWILSDLQNSFKKLFTILSPTRRKCACVSVAMVAVTFDAIAVMDVATLTVLFVSAVSRIDLIEIFQISKISKVSKISKF